MWHCSLRQHPSACYMWWASYRTGPGSWHCGWKWFLMTYSAGQYPPDLYVSISCDICGILSVHVNRYILQTCTSDTRTWCSVSDVSKSYEPTSCPSNLQVSPGVLQIRVHIRSHVVAWAGDHTHEIARSVISFTNVQYNQTGTLHDPHK